MMAGVAKWILLPLAALLAADSGVAGGELDADQKKLLAEADTIARRVAELRGLEIMRPIRRGVMSKEQITERLLARVKQDYKPGEIAGEELALKRLGLLAPDADYLRIVIDVLTEQIAGFYDPAERQLFIADWISVGNEMIMAHEIDHALQDQHFHLRRWIAADRKNADATLARQALVEGDGVAVMLEFTSPHAVPWEQGNLVDSVSSMMVMGMTMLGDVPLVIKEELMFPYVAGLRFVAEVRKTRPWSAVDEIFRKPPLSTEHILHPSTYAAYERPVEVRAAGVPALAGLAKRHDNVLGQLGLSVLLRQHKVAEPTARIAAAGWGGDRVAVFAPPGSRASAAAVAVLYTVWDTEVDAVEFFSAIGEAMPSLSGGREAARKPDLVEYRSGGTVTSAERRGDSVVVVVGARADAAVPLRAQVWKTWTVRRRP